MAKDTKQEAVAADNKKENRGYVCPEGEEHLVHLMVKEKKTYDPETGEARGREFVQKFGVEEFRLVVKKHLDLTGYTYDVLHMPAE